jgi:aspartate aminotransferase-like enzyme
MTFDPETATFLIAGPVRIHPRVLRAMSFSSVNHRGDYFHQRVGEIREMLPMLFGSPGHHAILSGSGTAGLEAMYSALLRPDDRVVVLSNGNFGERGDEIARRYSNHVTTLSAPWGHPVSVDALAAELEKGNVRAVVMVHNETSAGFANDVASFAPVVRKSDALFLVDGISSVAGLPVRIQEWGIDGVVTGSQKGLAAPAGLALVHLSDRAFAEVRPRTQYLDLAAHFKSLEKNDTPWTPAIPLFLALHEALILLQEEGLEARIARTHALAEATRAAVDALGLELFAERRYASDTVSAIKIPDGMDDASIRKVLLNTYNVEVQGGQAAYKGKIFRIGHMGIASWADLLVCFAGLERILGKAGRAKAPGAALAAIESRMP